MYPSARVLYVDNLQGDKKEIRLRQIANDDWDVIVVPHSLISSLALREETMMRMAEDDIKALEAEFFDAAEFLDQRHDLQRGRSGYHEFCIDSAHYSAIKYRG